MNRFCLIILWLVGLGFASDIISYEAQSAVSQEEANNIAVAGVAKQVSADVTASQKLTVSEETVDSKITVKENFSATSQVHSDVTLKWIEIEVLPKKGKNFCARATIDIGAVKSSVRMRLGELQQEISTHESTGLKALKNRQLKKAADALSAAIPKVYAYNGILDDLSRFMPLEESLKLEHGLHDLEDQLIAKLSGVTLEVLTKSVRYQNDAFYFDVKVKDDVGPLKDFPIQVFQGAKLLTAKQTGANGIARFELIKLSKKDDALVINIYADFAEGLLNNSGLNQGIVLSHQFEKSLDSEGGESLKKFVLKCSYSAGVCGAVKEALKSNKIDVVESDAPKLKFSYDSRVVRELNTSNATLITYDFLISISGEEISYQKNFTSAAKSKEAALLNAIKKIKF